MLIQTKNIWHSMHFNIMPLFAILYTQYSYRLNWDYWFCSIDTEKAIA